MKNLASVRQKETPAIDKAREDCIFCGLCTKNCRFLSEYEIMIGDLDELDAHKWSCYLCGRCSEVCPVNIDGMQVVWDMRSYESSRKSVAKTVSRGGAYCWEKMRYPFRNYRHAAKRSFFPGCSFLSNFPETTRAVYGLLAETIGAGIVYDCCGSPIYELGLGDTTASIVSRLSKRLSAHGVEEIFTACPHCYELLNGNLPQKVRTVYEVLPDDVIVTSAESRDDKDCGASGDTGKPLEDGDGRHTLRLYPPCPDRRMGYKMLRTLEPHIDGKPEIWDRSQCCGFGGNAAKEEHRISVGLAKDIGDERLCTYCASCANALGTFAGTTGRHILSLLLGIDETADTRHSFINRAKSTFV